MSAKATPVQDSVAENNKEAGIDCNSTDKEGVDKSKDNKQDSRERTDRTERVDKSKDIAERRQIEVKELPNKIVGRGVSKRN